jgi:hypothetical protein
LRKRFRSYVETLRIILKEYATDAAEGGTFPRGTPRFPQRKRRGESLVFFVLPKLILRRPQNRTEAEQGIIRAC